MADPPTIVTEEEELQIELQKLERFPKIRKWLQLFLDKTNKVTFGNRTQSAMIAYNLSEDQINSAAVIGSENYRKLKVVASLYYDQDGMTTAKILDLIAAHAVTGKPLALKMLAEITGVYDPKVPQTFIQNNNNQTNMNVQVTPEDQKKIAQEFEDFLDWKYGSPFAKPQSNQPVAPASTD